MENPFYAIEEASIGNIRLNAQSQEKTYQETPFGGVGATLIIFFVASLMNPGQP